MGIPGLFQKLKRSKMNGEPWDPLAKTDVHFEIDILGTFFWFLISQLTKGVDPVRVGESLANYLTNFFDSDQDRCTLHMDGAPTRQKRKARDERANTRAKTRQRVQKDLDIMQRRSNDGKWTSQSIVHRIQRDTPRLYILTEQTKAALRQGLATRYQVCPCQGEADTCIAVKIKEEPRMTNGNGGHRIAVSADSDLLVYEDIPYVLRRNPTSQEYSLYTKTSVIKALDLPSAAHLTVLGVVCNNDYSPNIEQYNIGKNAKILRGVVSAGMTTTAIFRAYRKEMRNKVPGFDFESFNPARDIFIQMNHTVEVDVVNNNDYNAFVTRFEALKQHRFQVRAQQLAQQAAQQQAAQPTAQQAGPPPQVGPPIALGAGRRFVSCSCREAYHVDREHRTDDLSFFFLPCYLDFTSRRDRNTISFGRCSTRRAIF